MIILEHLVHYKNLHSSLQVLVQVRYLSKAQAIPRFLKILVPRESYVYKGQLSLGLSGSLRFLNQSLREEEDNEAEMEKR